MISRLAIWQAVVDSTHIVGERQRCLEEAARNAQRVRHWRRKTEALNERKP